MVEEGPVNVDVLVIENDDVLPATLAGEEALDEAEDEATIEEDAAVWKLDENSKLLKTEEVLLATKEVEAAEPLGVTTETETPPTGGL